MTTPSNQHTSWDQELRSGTAPVQDAFLELVRRTRDSRHYCPSLIWGNLQTADYARAVLGHVVSFREIPDDVEAGVAKRSARAKFIGQGGRTYHALLGEQALRTNLGGADVMCGQLTHLRDALDLAGLKLGIIPSRAELALYPGHSFSIFDGDQVMVETFSAALTITDKAEVAIYEKAFALLEQSTVYGQQARDLIEAELRALG
ncbi:DUF5753 domain-containing protein [Streptomyces sp. 21So2-11]|uniref:DUF5753 domain-containing protein n=1 Tax=Streptomyces sp. 21So2-11 TaxID=3144408 RepID=UPI003218FAC0